ncbi:MATE family efflux transporter [Clostridium sp. Marseille-P299]|uniref:MATE family efflux transporter n=1 Tax=Clostridium sp. Marseille-P299 TaxID=1805477 RepID=UPI00082F7D3E|nr:MATE family efflux transporter [Clostridium sp. Marseille-P299]
MDKNILQKFVKYVSLNILGMIGLSCYILADTFFVSKALGATGVAALNFSISIYSVINGTGLMIGIGGATRYSILKSQNDDKKANAVFSSSVMLGILLGIIFAIIGIFGSKPLAMILGADSVTLPLTKTYLTTILCFAPFFIMNNILLAFVRNDNDPKLSMIAMLTGSLSNVFLDYMFIFPLGMGMFGAAFATGLAPIISIGVLSIHFIKGKNNFAFIKSKLRWRSTCDIFSLGLSAFITEVSSAVVLITFNLVIIGLKGNLGVASYGIVANIALVGVAIFTGIAQGIQPLVSHGYGMANHDELKKVMKYALITSLGIASLIYITVFYKADDIVGIFNSENNIEIAQIAKTGLQIYFLGFFFAGINIIMATYFSATERARDAFLISIARGCIIIVPLVLILSTILKMTGIWLAFVFTECVVTIITMIIVKSNKFK